MRTRALALLILSLIMTPVRVEAQTQNVEQIKAAFILNFIRFTEFSRLHSDENTIDSQNITLCLVSSESVFSHFTLIENKEAHGRKISLIQLANDTKDVAHCQIIYFSSSLAARKSLIERATEYDALTIGDYEDFIEQGGIIRFYLADGKIRFEISPNNASKAQIRLSSKLLSIAKINDGDEG